MVPHPSSSEVQSRAEPELVRAVSAAIKVPLTKQTLNLGAGCTVQLDGYNEARRIACEAFARIGSLNPGQKRKLGNDILKLILFERLRGGSWRKILVVAGEDALASLSGRSWQAQAVREFGIELFQVPLGAALVAELVAAQTGQVMVNISRPDA